LNELPVILIIEDDYPIQGIVEDALAEGGFATDILSSGEEALTLFRGRLRNYKALVTDVALKGRLNGGGSPDQGSRPYFSCHLHERGACRRMGVKGRSQ
jgi:CheY-like chemotaxis protein